jgi:hypothetical protein
LRSFYKELEPKVEKKQLKLFTQTTDSASIIFKKFHPTFFEVYYDSIQKTRLDEYFTSIHFYGHQDDKKEYLCFGFHLYMNNKTFSDDDIIKEYFDEYSRKSKRTSIQDSIKMFKSIRFALSNNRNCYIGKIFDLTFPVNVQGAKTAYYADNPNYEGAYDSLKVTVKILNRKYPLNLDGVQDSSDASYWLKILKMSNPKYDIEGYKYKIGDVLILRLRKYVRLIE